MDINDIIGATPPVIKDNSNKNTLPKNHCVTYDDKHIGPYVVYIESERDSNTNIGKLSTLKIAREIFNLNLKDIRKINNKGANRLSIEFLNANSANNFIKNETIAKRGLKTYIPGNFITCKGIVRNIDVDEDINDHKKFCRANVDIIDAKRLNRKIIKDNKPEYVPTGTILFTFKGTNLPQYIYYYNLPHPVQIYIPPVTQCFSCLLYGHTRKNCKGKEKCFNCAGTKHDLEETGDFTCTSKCHFCRENHKSTNKNCPEYKRQQNIKKLMAFENIPFFDAEKKCPKTYIQREEYIYDPRTFPKLRNTNNKTNNQEQVIIPSQRRTAEFNGNKTKRTFQQAVSTENNKRRVIQKGYDKDAHNNELYFPNSRPSTSFDPFHSQTENTQTSTPKSAFSLDLNESPPHDISNYMTLFKSNFYELSYQQRLAFKKIFNSLPMTQYQDKDDPTL